MPWPASIVNIMHLLGWTMTATIFTEGMVVCILNIFLVGEFVPRVFGWELVFLLPYSILMQVFATIWRDLGIDALPIIERFIFDLLGLVIAFAGYALYQGCGCFHPHDRLTVVLRRRASLNFTKYFNIVLPLLIISLCVIKNHTVYALNLGTVIGFFTQNWVVSFWQRHFVRHCHLWLDLTGVVRCAVYFLP